MYISSIIERCDLAFLRPFGFALDTISVPTLVVHGHQDQVVPIDHGDGLARVIPGAEAWLLVDEGHLSLITRRIPDVHAWLLGTRPALTIRQQRPGLGGVY